MYIVTKRDIEQVINPTRHQAIEKNDWSRQEKKVPVELHPERRESAVQICALDSRLLDPEPFNIILNNSKLIKKTPQNILKEVPSRCCHGTKMIAVPGCSWITGTAISPQPSPGVLLKPSLLWKTCFFMDDSTLIWQMSTAFHSYVCYC